MYGHRKSRRSYSRSVGPFPYALDERDRAGTSFRSDCMRHRPCIMSVCTHLAHVIAAIRSGCRHTDACTIGGWSRGTARILRACPTNTPVIVGSKKRVAYGAEKSSTAGLLLGEIRTSYEATGSQCPFRLSVFGQMCLSLFPQYS